MNLLRSGAGRPKCRLKRALRILLENKSFIISWFKLQAPQKRLSDGVKITVRLSRPWIAERRQLWFFFFLCRWSHGLSSGVKENLVPPVVLYGSHTHTHCTMAEWWVAEQAALAALKISPASQACMLVPVHGCQIADTRPWRRLGES